MRIATIYNRGTPNAHYRAVVPLREMERRRHTVLWPAGEGSLLGLVDGTSLRWDVMHLQQQSSSDDIEAVRRLRARGVGVVWDSDDDLSAMPRHAIAYARLGKRGARDFFRRTVEIAREAHVMTTTSPHLAELYRGEGVEHVEVVENYLARPDVPWPRRRHQGLVIGCCAAQEHEGDLKKLKIGKALQRLLESHPHVRVVMLGCDVKLSGPRYSRTRGVPFEQLLAHESEFDIGIAPLGPGQFSQARSNVKLKEYAAAGAMWAASPRGAYSGLGEEEGGVLVDDRDWFEVLDSLVRDQERRRTLTERARAWAARQTIGAGARQWEAIFRTARARAQRG